MAGIVGAAGLKSTWAALEAGKRVAFANKETLVVAGPLVTALAEPIRWLPDSGRQRTQCRFSGPAGRESK